MANVPDTGGNRRTPRMPYGPIDYAKMRLAAQNFGAYNQQARQNVGQAFARPPRRDQRVAMPGGPVVERQEPDPTMGMVMTYNQATGAPIYYGTQEARDLTINGLKRVLAGRGPGSTAFSDALFAARGVLGPEYENLLDPFLPQARRPQQTGFGYGGAYE